MTIAVMHALRLVTSVTKETPHYERLGLLPLAVLGGPDALVFTAGIGENSTEVRAAACANLEFVGLKLDTSKNAQPCGDQDISAPDSTVRVLVLRAQEDWAKRELAGEIGD